MGAVVSFDLIDGGGVEGDSSGSLPFQAFLCSSGEWKRDSRNSPTEHLRRSLSGLLFSPLMNDQESLWGLGVLFCMNLKETLLLKTLGFCPKLSHKNLIYFTPHPSDCFLRVLPLERNYTVGKSERKLCSSSLKTKAGVQASLQPSLSQRRDTGSAHARVYRAVAQNFYGNH